MSNKGSLVFTYSLPEGGLASLIPYQLHQKSAKRSSVTNQHHPPLLSLLRRPHSYIRITR